MVNYQNGKIYKIVSAQTDKVYIGSTTKNRLCQRMTEHRAGYKRYLNEKFNYLTSYEIIKYDDAEIILIESFPCETKDELHKRERYWIENTNNCVNKQVPTRTKKELKDNKIEYDKNYREKNREQINKKIGCACGGQYTRKHKAEHEKTKKHISFVQNNSV